MMLTVRKLHVPLDDDIDAALQENVTTAGRRHVTLDTQYAAGDDTVEWNTNTAPQAIRVADIVILDMWDACTRAEQARALTRLSSAVHPSALVLLKYSDIDAFTFDGLMHCGSA